MLRGNASSFVFSEWVDGWAASKQLHNFCLVSAFTSFFFFFLHAASSRLNSVCSCTLSHGNGFQEIRHLLGYFGGVRVHMRVCTERN